MLFKSALVTQASGSVGGLTASRNAAGMYLKAKPLPVNPNSPLQQQVRANMSSIAQDWLGMLTQAQRDVYNLYAGNVTLKNVFGDDVFRSGFQHFIRTNSVALLAGGTLIEDGPTIFNLGETDPSLVASASEATQNLTIAFDDTLDWVDLDNAFMQISMSRPANASQEFIKPTYRVAGYIDGDSVTAPTTPATIAAPFPIAEDQKVLIRGRILLSDGRLSEPFLNTITVAS